MIFAALPCRPTRLINFEGPKTKRPSDLLVAETKGLDARRDMTSPTPTPTLSARASQGRDRA